MSVKFKLLLLFLITFSLGSSFAITPDEGLWLPFFQKDFNYDYDMNIGSTIPIYVILLQLYLSEACLVYVK